MTKQIPQMTAPTRLLALSELREVTTKPEKARVLLEKHNCRGIDVATALRVSPASISQWRHNPTMTQKLGRRPFLDEEASEILVHEITYNAEHHHVIMSKLSV